MRPVVFFRASLTHLIARSLDHLYAAFPLLPAALIKKTFVSPDCASFFAPTYQLLNKRLEAGEYDAQKLRKGRKPPKKTMRLSITNTVDEEGKSHRVVEEIEAEVPEELKQEIEWLKARLREFRFARFSPRLLLIVTAHTVRERHERLRAEREEKAAQEERERVELLNEQARQNGEAVECGCCFDEVALENSGAYGIIADSNPQDLTRLPSPAAQCAEGHLFCKTCAVANASDRIGRRQAVRSSLLSVEQAHRAEVSLSQVLPCMTAECTATFPPATYSSFLPPRMIESLASIAQQVDLDTAFDGVDGFEKCPCVRSPPASPSTRANLADASQLLPVRLLHRKSARTSPALRAPRVQEGHLPSVQEGEPSPAVVRRGGQGQSTCRRACGRW